MNEIAVIKDMRKALARIITARAPVRLHTDQDGVAVETSWGLTTGLRPLRAVVTWEALAETPKPLIKPLVDELIHFIERGGPPPASFRSSAAAWSEIERRHLH